MARLPDLDQITAFLAVAEELSFRRAAERLAIDQSALSRRIKDLEGRIGYQLLHRTTHSVRLSDAGRHFYEANHRIVERLGEAVSTAGRIARGSKGCLRVAYMTFAGIELLPQAVADFRQRSPEVALILSYQRTELQKVSLARGEIDVGIMLGPFANPGFEVRELASEPVHLLVPDGHRLAGRPQTTVAEAAAEPMVLGTHEQWDFYRAMVLDILAVRGVEPNIAYEAPSLTGIVGLVRAGLGVTIVPGVVARAVPPGLAAIEIADAGRAISTVAVWRQPAEQSTADFAASLARVARQD